MIRQVLDHSHDGVDIAGSINVAVAANLDEQGSSHASATSTQRIVQRSGQQQQTSSERSGSASGRAAHRLPDIPAGRSRADVINQEAQ